MLDTLLPIPNAKYPAFYPIGIKASCVCVAFVILPMQNQKIMFRTVNCSPSMQNIPQNRLRQGLAANPPPETVLRRTPT
jgi:hypothetical protein